MGQETHDTGTERAYLPVAAPPTNHGHTRAAWVTVTLVLLGGVISSLAFIVSQVWMFWAGMGVVVVGVIAGYVLKMLGFGQPTQRREKASEGAVDD
ncbi:HGxxPAAW family protein [Cellulomonas bogoriensis]|uniref:Membrane protein n=1 Tax=Cellulomonas bogoriensis 69B4 = DSM 16987 TaxID=1386082 RepID=A0A0A0C140_9CELL|nr:HGxxPAAW family protein [Cellulomonas bogoriensis]KGM14348.1 membrane protein [Cellulomonas bogoriensis 69B4 = DSM 16987]